MSWNCRYCAKRYWFEINLIEHMRRAHSIPPEHAADSPGGVSGRILGSPAERSEAGNKGSTPGQSRVPRRSVAQPGNGQAQSRTK